MEFAVRNSQSFIQRFVALSLVMLSVALSFAIAGVAHAQQVSTQVKAQQLPSGPRIWLQDNRPLTVEHLPAVYSDAATVQNPLIGNFSSLSKSQPVAMTYGDLDQDGIDDLAVGYRS